MTVTECIQYVDEIKPNAFPEAAKLRWLSQLEGKIASEIFLMAPAELQQFRYGTEEKNHTLLVDSPYDDLYIAFLTAKVDSKNGEFNKLSTAAQAYNRLWDELNAYIANLYNPAAGYYGRHSTDGAEQRAAAQRSEEGAEEFGIVG